MTSPARTPGELQAMALKACVDEEWAREEEARFRAELAPMDPAVIAGWQAKFKRAVAEATKGKPFSVQVDSFDELDGVVFTVRSGELAWQMEMGTTAGRRMYENVPEDEAAKCAGFAELAAQREAKKWLEDKGKQLRESLLEWADEHGHEDNEDVRRARELLAEAERVLGPMKPDE